MVDGKGLLDALLGAASTGGHSGRSEGGLGDILGQVLGGTQQNQSGQGSGGLGALLGQILGGNAAQTQDQTQAQADPTAGGLGDMLNQVLAGAGGASGGGLIDAVKNVITKNPGLAQTAAIGAAGLLLGTQTGRGLAVNAAKLGGVALIGGLAYRALKSFQEKHDATGTAAEELPAPQEYDAVATTQDGALKLVRAMVAAAMADGKIDDSERQRITGEMGQAALTGDQVAWLNNEMANPASVQQLAASTETAQEAVEVYTSARIAIDPDSPPNKAFLISLSQALQLPAPLLAELDKAVDSVKVGAAA